MRGKRPFASPPFTKFNSALSDFETFMINVDDLLKPVADDKPCGEDFTYHPSFQNLESLSRGKPETQFSQAEDPDWKEVRDAALEVLGQSKHLTAGVILTVSLVKIGGIEGLRNGLAAIHGMIEKYWNDVYPKLDPDDNNDPTERLNILNNLSSAGEPYKFTAHVKQIVMCDPRPWDASRSGKSLLRRTRPGKMGVPIRDLNQIQAAFRDAGPEAAKATLTLVTETIGHAQGIESFLDSTIGAGRGVNFESLDKLLEEMKRAVEPFAANGRGRRKSSGRGRGDRRRHFGRAASSSR